MLSKKIITTIIDRLEDSNNFSINITDDTQRNEVDSNVLLLKRNNGSIIVYNGNARTYFKLIEKGKNNWEIFDYFRAIRINIAKNRGKFYHVSLLR